MGTARRPARRRSRARVLAWNGDRNAAAEPFDLIIIGSGSGNSIPEYLADWNIALVERDVFGGTCLNRGCIPSKMFVLPADLAESPSPGAAGDADAEAGARQIARSALCKCSWYGQDP